MIALIVHKAEHTSSWFAHYQNRRATPIWRIYDDLAVRHRIDFKAVGPDWIEFPQEDFGAGQQILGWDGEAVLLRLIGRESQVGEGICEVLGGLSRSFTYIL